MKRGVLFHGKQLRRLPSMIFWWSWGKREFDIRCVREALGHSRERKEDYVFTCCGDAAIAAHLEAITGTRAFDAVLDEADRISEAETLI